LSTQLPSQLQIANYCLWGHVAEWLRNGLQNRRLSFSAQCPFWKSRKIQLQSCQWFSWAFRMRAGGGLSSAANWILSSSSFAIPILNHRR